MKKLRRNKLGGLMVPVSEIGAAHKPKPKPRDNLALGIRMESGQLSLWPAYMQYAGKIEWPMPFKQWYEAHHGEQAARRERLPKAD